MTQRVLGMVGSERKARLKSQPFPSGERQTSLCVWQIMGIFTYKRNLCVSSSGHCPPGWVSGYSNSISLPVKRGCVVMWKEPGSAACQLCGLGQTTPPSHAPASSSVLCKPVRIVSKAVVEHCTRGICLEAPAQRLTVPDPVAPVPFNFTACQEGK